MQGSPFKTLNNIYEHLPFFCCVNHVLDDSCQRDIAKYIFCEDTNTSPYPGSYESIPVLWVEKHFIIKAAVNLRNKILSEKRNA